jgi:hypothetical protein
VFWLIRHQVCGSFESFISMSTVPSSATILCR